MTAYMKLTEIKSDLLKAIKFEDGVSVAVKIFDCDDDNNQTYDVEISYYIDGDYVDTFISDTFEDGDAKEAIKRSNLVLSKVKVWFAGRDVEVVKSVEVYS